MAKKKNSEDFVYYEPVDYFPKEIRKKYKLGEFYEEKSDTDCGGIPGPTNQEIFISLYAEKAADIISKMPEGSQSSISVIINDILAKEGYKNIDVGVRAIHAWEKDGRETRLYLHEDDLLDILEKTECLLKGKCRLDFSKNGNQPANLPFNLMFTVRKQK